MRTIESYPMSYLRNGGPDRGASSWFIADISSIPIYYEDVVAPDISDGFIIPAGLRLIQYLDYDVGRGRRTLYFEVKAVESTVLTVSLRMLRHVADYTVGTPSFQVYQHVIHTTTVAATSGEWVRVLYQFEMDYPDDPGSGQEIDFVYEIHSDKTVSVRKIGLAAGYHTNPIYWGDPFIDVVPQGAIVFATQDELLPGFEKVSAQGIIQNSVDGAVGHSNWPEDVEYDANDAVGTWCADAELNTSTDIQNKLHPYGIPSEHPNKGPVHFGNTRRTAHFESENILTVDATSIISINDLHRSRKDCPSNIYAAQKAATGGEHVHTLQELYVNVFYRRLFLWRKL